MRIGLSIEGNSRTWKNTTTVVFTNLPGQNTVPSSCHVWRQLEKNQDVLKISLEKRELHKYRYIGMINVKVVDSISLTQGERFTNGKLFSLILKFCSSFQVIQSFVICFPSWGFVYSILNSRRILKFVEPAVVGSQMPSLFYDSAGLPGTELKIAQQHSTENKLWDNKNFKRRPLGS